MKTVTIYTKPLCPFCVRALALLRKKGVVTREISAAFDSKLRAEMIRKANGRSTYPQIFIGDDHVGGCDDLHALEAAGKLDAMLHG